MNLTRLLIVDDHAIVRQGIQMFLQTEPSIEIVGEAEDGQAAIRQAKRFQPDVILMDLVMADRDGLEVMAAIKACLPGVKIVVLTTFNDPHRFEAALKAGADGYLLKNADGEALLHAIQAVRRGDLPLHPEVTHHLMRGLADVGPRPRPWQLTERDQAGLELLA